MTEKQTQNAQLGYLIKTKRKEKGLTQTQLAQITGLSPRHIGKLEDGTYCPNLNTYLKLSSILEFNIENIKTMQKYTPRKTEAKILNLLRNCTDAELELCLRLVETVKNNRPKHLAN